MYVCMKIYMYILVRERERERERKREREIRGILLHDYWQGYVHWQVSKDDISPLASSSLTPAFRFGRSLIRSKRKHTHTHTHTHFG